MSSSHAVANVYLLLVCVLAVYLYHYSCLTVHLEMQGQAQSTDTALELFSLLSSSDTKLRQPVGLEMQLMQDMRMDSDVSRSMLQLLQVCHSVF